MNNKYAFKVLSHTDTWFPHVTLSLSPFCYEYSLCCWPYVFSFRSYYRMKISNICEKWTKHKNTRQCLLNLSWFIHSENRMCLLILYILFKKICKINWWSHSFNQTNSLSSFSHMLAVLRPVCVAQVYVCIDPLWSSVSGMLSFNCQVTLCHVLSTTSKSLYKFIYDFC